MLHCGYPIFSFRGKTDAFTKLNDGDIILAIDGNFVASSKDVELAVQVRHFAIS
jgi:hypothetical protein